MKADIDALARDIARCRICVERPQVAPLPHEPRPVAVLSRTARIAICGQAPGTRVHASGVPFTDPSGDRLREWMGVDEATFYDRSRIAIVPMGFCFPGLDTKGGDLPPRRECAASWRTQVFQSMPQIELMLVIGQYAQAWHLGALRKGSVTQTVAEWRAFASASSQPLLMPLPHPSWRNNGWIRKNPWFSNALLPELQELIQRLL
ncbi:MAG: uracil-DNA glycosylase family protein [Rhizobiaceae bacterium]